MMGHIHYHPNLKDHTLCNPLPADEFNFSEHNPMGLPEGLNVTKPA